MTILAIYILQFPIGPMNHCLDHHERTAKQIYGKFRVFIIIQSLWTMALGSIVLVLMIENWKEKQTFLSVHSHSYYYLIQFGSLPLFRLEAVVMSFSLTMWSVRRAVLPILRSGKYCMAPIGNRFVISWFREFLVFV